MSDRTDDPDRHGQTVQTGTAPAAPQAKPVRHSRWSAWRSARAEAANNRRAERDRQAAQRQTELTERRQAAITAAADRSAQSETDHVPAVIDSTPLPQWMRTTGVWLDRTAGSLPLLAPLTVSGWYTYHVGTEALTLPGLVALALTLALEGGIWKLSRLYEKTLVAGDSTIALRIGLTGYILATGGLIFWHADRTGQAWQPAAVVATMALAGLYIWSRQARWARRDQLRSAGRVDTQAPKFSGLAWLLTPLETPAAMRHAVKYRIDSPIAAITDRRLYKAAGRPKVWPPIPDRPARRTAAPTDTDHGAPSAADRRTVRSDPRPTNGNGRTGGTVTPINRPPRQHGPAALRDAATLADRYGSLLPDRNAIVRELGWGGERASKARNARVDQLNADQSDDDKERPLVGAAVGA